MKLFIVHVGYYDHEVGIYELHTNFFVAAHDVRDARHIIKEKPIFQQKKMHIDAVQEIEVVDGYRVTLTADQGNATQVKNYGYTELQ